MDKVIRDGKVAVAYSPSLGAGWVTWNIDNDLNPFHPEVILMIEAKRQMDIDKDWCKEHLGLDNVYCGAAASLRIEWVPEGSVFEITEYNGAERIKIIKLDNSDYWVA